MKCRKKFKIQGMLKYIYNFQHINLQEGKGNCLVSPTSIKSFFCKISDPESCLLNRNVRYLGRPVINIHGHGHSQTLFIKKQLTMHNICLFNFTSK